MPPRARPLDSKVVKRAIAQSPSTIRPKRDARRFQAYTVSQLLETYRDPRAVLLEIASMDTKTLANLMAGRNADDDPLPAYLVDAIAERRLCAQAVLPYVAQKLPVQVDMRHTKAIHLNIVDDRQYQELVEISTEPAPGDDMQLQLIGSAIAEERTTDDAERGVVPPVATTSQDSDDTRKTD